MAGWIKINRKIIEHWLWQDAERLKWWLDLLFMASWEERKTTHDAHLITLQRGQMVASIGYLKDRWGKNHQTILKFLKTLETEGMITRKVLYRQTAIITICNYESYQAPDSNEVYRQVDSTMYSINEKSGGTTMYRQKSGSSNCKSDTLRHTEEKKVYSITDGIAYSIVATNKESKEYNNNISSSLRSEEHTKEVCEKSDEILEKAPRNRDVAKVLPGWLREHGIESGEELHDVLDAFAEMRVRIRKPLTARAVKLNLNEAWKLSNGSIATMVQIFDQSISNSWCGVFALRENLLTKPFPVQLRGGQAGFSTGVYEQMKDEEVPF